MSNFKRVVAVAAVVGLVSSGVAMADPLAAGKPAGVKNAQMEGVSPLIWVAVAGVVAAGIAIGASSGSSGSTFNTVTPSTGATG